MTELQCNFTFGIKNNWTLQICRRQIWFDLRSLKDRESAKAWSSVVEIEDDDDIW